MTTGTMTNSGGKDDGNSDDSDDDDRDNDSKHDNGGYNDNDVGCCGGEGGLGSGTPSLLPIVPSPLNLLCEVPR